jgi:D-glycero-alpha-D-manno-heptose-7-phosphate kinase
MYREELNVDIKILEDRTVVIYTGEPRASGTNNWDITKRHIDGDPELFDIFEGIRDTALKLRCSLVAGDWAKAGEVLRLGYPQRKRLSPHIATPHMEHLIEVAEANGAIATKVCGAGGGGCIAFFCEEGRKADVEAALRSETDAEVLEWRIAEKGLNVTVSQFV